MIIKLFIVLLIVLIAIIYLLYTLNTEIKVIKDDILNEIQSSVVKLKQSNTEAITAIRKISHIESQPITKKMNHFTENDSEYVQEKKTSPSCYMSNEEDKNKNTNSNSSSVTSSEEESVMEPFMFNPMSLFQNIVKQNQNMNNQQAQQTRPVIEVASDEEKEVSSLNTIDVDELNDETQDQEQEPKQEKLDSDMPELELELENTNNIDIGKTETHTLEELKRIAKEHNIPISYKVGGKWKPMNKEELNNKLKDVLSK
jgi:hypothetical protein